MNQSSRRIRSSVKQSFASTLVVGIVQFGILVVLARLLTPEDYGQYAHALIISSLSVLLGNNILERTLVLEADESKLLGLTPTLFLILLVVVALAWSACAMLHWLLGWQVPLGVLAALLVGQGLAVLSLAPRIDLRRKIQFGPIAISEVAGQFIGTGVVAIICALSGLGAYSIAIGAAVQNLIIAAVLYRAVPNLIMSPPTFRQLKRIVGASIAIGQTAMLEISSGQVPFFLVSIRFGSDALGLFNRAFYLVQLPVQLLVNSMGRVMISGLFSLTSEPLRLRRAMRLLVRIAAAIITPVLAGMAGANHAFILTVLGSQWVAAVDMVPWLALGTWFSIMGNLLGTLVEATRHLKEKAQIQGASLVMLAIGVAAGSNWGLLGAAAGTGIASAGFFLLNMRLTARILDVRWADILAWTIPGLTAAIPCALAARYIDYALDRDPVITLSVQVAACGILTVTCYLTLFRELTREVLTNTLPKVITARRIRGRGQDSRPPE